MKKSKFNIDKGTVLGIIVTCLGIASTILTSKVDSNNRQTMKNELKAELLEELTSANLKG